MPWTRFATRLLDGEFEIRSNAVVRDRKRSGKRDESVHWTLYLVSKNPGRNEKKKNIEGFSGSAMKRGSKKATNGILRHSPPHRWRLEQASTTRDIAFDLPCRQVAEG